MTDLLEHLGTPGRVAVVSWILANAAILVRLKIQIWSASRGEAPPVPETWRREEIPDSGEGTSEGCLFGIATLAAFSAFFWLLGGGFWTIPLMLGVYIVMPIVVVFGSRWIFHLSGHDDLLTWASSVMFGIAAFSVAVETTW